MNYFVSGVAYSDNIFKNENGAAPPGGSSGAATGYDCWLVMTQKLVGVPTPTIILTTWD